jgi:tetratricopeptide (TPR) repeat protein
MMDLRHITAFALIIVSTAASAEVYETQVEVSQTEVDAWNRFATSLLTLHRKILANTPHRVERSTSSYGGEYAGGYEFVDERFHDKKTGNLLSHIRWHNKKKGEVHTIEVFIYDQAGKLQRDYTAAYLPKDRNAPIQTLINFHTQKDRLHAYRQFDANGELLFEKCAGEYMGGRISLSLEDYEIPDNPFDVTGDYLACFSSLPRAAGIYLDPLSEIHRVKENDGHAANAGSDSDYHELVKQYTSQLENSPADARLLIRRGDALFMLHEFEGAIQDYSRAIKIDPALDDAWFGRGMAYGRNRQFDQAIADLTVYLQRNPESSRGYTKRGVRYIWMGKLDLAKQDLRKAVAIDPSNAEANDDLGVLYAQEKQYERAAQHFHNSIKHDPGYQKAHHNLAMVNFLTGRQESALSEIEKALELDSQNRNSAMLKSEILARMGRADEAAEISENARLMEETNWSEQMTPVQ